MSQLEKISELEHRIAIEIPQEEVAALFNQKLAEIAGSTNLKGFRPGKVPANVIESRFGKQVSAEVAEKLIQKSLQEAMKEHDVNMAGMPKIDCEVLNKKEKFTYTATFEVYPELNLVDLDGVAVEKLEVALSDSDVAKTAETLAKQKIQWQEEAGASAKGDKLTFDFQGLIDGEAFDGGTAENFELELGSGLKIPGFEAGLEGLKAGDESDIEVTFPEDYGVEKLAGKPAVFKIKVHKVERCVLPEINADLAKELGFDSVEALQEEIKKNLTREYGSAQRNHFKQTVLDLLLERNEFSVPAALIDTEIEHMQKMFMQKMAAQQGKKELPKIDLPREPYEKEAKKRVMLGLLLAEVIKKFEITVDADKVDARLAEIASSYEDAEQVIQWYRSNKQSMAELEASVIEEQAIEKLVENANVSISSLSYEDFTKKINEKETKDES